MDWRTFIVEMTKAVAWPAVFTAVLLLFYRQVGTLLVVAVRSLRRLKTFKYGGVELALEVVEAAAVATEKVADAVTHRIATEDLPPAEKERLLGQLKESTADAERLRNILAHGVSNEWSRHVRRNMMLKGGPIAVHSLLVRLVKELSVDRVQQMAGSNPDELRQEVGKLVNQARAGNSPTWWLSEAEIEILVSEGLIEYAGPATSFGIRQLRNVATVLENSSGQIK